MVAFVAIYFLSRRNKEDLAGDIGPDFMKQAAEIFEKAFKEQMKTSEEAEAEAEQEKTEV